MTALPGCTPARVNVSDSSVACTKVPLRNAAFIAASLAPMTLVEALADGATVKDGYIGLASAIGVMAADLAAEGLTALRNWPPEVLKALPVDVYDTTPVTGDQGWLVLSGGLHFKTDDVAAMSQPALAALRSLLRRRPLPAKQIAAIEVRSSRRIAIGGNRAPQNIVAAKTSVPFLVALALTHLDELLSNQYGVGWLEASMLTEPETLRLAGLVRLVADEEMDRGLEQDWPMSFAARVVLTTVDGEVVEEQADIWPGTSNMTFDDVAAKFRAVTAGHLSADEAEALVAAVRQLDKTPDLDGFWTLLRSTFARPLAALTSEPRRAVE